MGIAGLVQRVVATSRALGQAWTVDGLRQKNASSCPLRAGVQREADLKSWNK